VDYAGLEKATGVQSGDIRSDIYFLGCVAYEILTGRPPLEMPKDARARMNRDRFLNVQPLSRDDVSGPPSLLRLVETMMMLNPLQRYQTPSQLLEAIRDVRRELEGKTTARPSGGARTLFVAEKDEKLQNIMRDKFKEEGFRVLLAADPARALERFRQQPFDVLVVDGRTTGEDGILKFERIMEEAHRQKVFCAGILLLGEDQAEWAGRIISRPTVVLLIQPKFKQVLHKIEELLKLRT
jgi:CheY-like chemotaxis protein